jgi:hypothetical protein
LCPASCMEYFGDDGEINSLRDMAYKEAITSLGLVRLLLSFKLMIGVRY